jgi:hypothetical protein
VRAESNCERRERRFMHYRSLGGESEYRMGYANRVAYQNNDPQNIHRADSGMSFRQLNITPPFGPMAINSSDRFHSL